MECPRCPAVTRGYSEWICTHSSFSPTQQLTSGIYQVLTMSNREGNGTPPQYSCLENPWTEEPGRLQSMGSLRVWHDWATSISLFTFMHWEGNGNPLQCSCLENPRDGRAWWAALYVVAQSWTQLKWLSSSSSNYERAPRRGTEGHK